MSNNTEMFLQSIDKMFDDSEEYTIHMVDPETGKDLGYTTNTFINKLWHSAEEHIVLI